MYNTDHSTDARARSAPALIPPTAKLELSARISGVPSVSSPGSDVVGLVKTLFDRDPAGLRFLEFCFR